MENKNKPDIRERTIENGLLYPTNVELLMLILGSGNKDMSVEVMAQKINDVLTDSNLEDVVGNLLKVKGVGCCRCIGIGAKALFSFKSSYSITGGYFALCTKLCYVWKRAFCNDYSKWWPRDHQDSFDFCWNHEQNHYSSKGSF